ncbi:hypothetical protein Rsub_00891 [Raphidocelis subcapitata]|uniref:Uncharacterized protein n=1 Tax=Raphidocelis subcapitata TaxID=307507 RepID=A0A2V0NM12_9CHLO|nr:hypothetical protein Rsub_00891 [Raphidocelis subcapitata]|eukprot:GBF88179.1 hypothetical protein Rsub_00891 [Raphidocelis subcapitata]
MGLPQQLAHHAGAFASSVRGDVTTERFVYTKPPLALADHPHRRPLTAQFMAAKAAENQLCVERIEAQPRGQRFQAGVEFLERIKAARRSQEEAEDAEMHLPRRARPEQLTSAANPLAAGWSADRSAHSVAVSDGAGSSDWDFDSEEDGDASEADEAAELGAEAGARASARSGQRSGGESDAEAAAAAEAAALRRRKAKARARKAAAERHRALNQDGHLETGSLSPRKGACAGPGEASPTPSAHERDAAAAAEAVERRRLLEQTRERMEREWPHGVPRRIAVEMRAVGLELPTPGFGAVSSSGPLQVAFSSRG